jgi:hypothetical protein
VLYTHREVTAIFAPEHLTTNLLGNTVKRGIEYFTFTSGIRLTIAIAMMMKMMNILSQ